MRTLNRPMFRYGGPIKEGVMNGIRETKRNGGSMNRQAALVGNPNFPMQDGRALHSEAATRSALEKIKQAFTMTAGSPKNVVKSLNPGKKIAMAKNIGLAALNPLKNFYRKQVGKLDMPPKFKSAGAEFKGAGTAGGGSLPMSLLDRAKYFATKNPKTTAAGVGVGASSGLLEGAVGGGLKLAGKGVLQVGDLLVSDKYFDQDKYLKEKFPNGLFGGKKDPEIEKNDTQTNIDKILSQPAKPKKSEKELRAEQIAKYRDIVDIKGMNKDAAYNSLIAASQAISGEGDFKGSLKDGSLINKIIQSTSKAYDKPKATKDAIDTLILKGEIEADIASGKAGAYEKQVAAVAKNLGVDVKTAQKMLIKQPTNIREQVIFDLASTKQSTPTHKTVVSSVKQQVPNAVVLLNADQAKEKLKKGQSAEDFLNASDTLTKIEDPSGTYIIGTEVVTVDKQGNTNTIFP